MCEALQHQDTGFNKVQHFYLNYQEHVYLAVRPAQFNFVHSPKFMDVFCQLVTDVLQMRGENNLQKGRKTYGTPNALNSIIMQTFINKLTWLVSTGVGIKEA